MLIPIPHHQTISAIAAEEPDLIAELDRFKDALTKLYASYGCKPLVFELGRQGGRGGHAHVQVLPIDEKHCDAVNRGFLEGGPALGVNWEADASVDTRDQSYFKVILPSGEHLTHILRTDAPFNLQFGRTILCQSVPAWEGRANWQDCAQSKEDEVRDVVSSRAF